MDVREKLVELLYDADKACNNKSCVTCKHQDKKFFCKIHFYIDHLVSNGVTVQEWISIEAGKLQNYIGVPVCIKRKTDGECWWAIIRGIKGDKVSTDYGGYFKLSEYGETWMVKYLPLPQPPKGE